MGCDRWLRRLGQRFNDLHQQFWQSNITYPGRLLKFSAGGLFDFGMPYSFAGKNAEVVEIRLPLNSNPGNAR